MLWCVARVVQERLEVEDLDRIKQQMLNYTLERIWTTEELREQLKVVCTCTCNADHSCSVQVLGCNC